MTNKVLKGKECKFATHIQSKTYSDDDHHLLKIINHYNDNSKEVELKIIKNFKRKFYVTKPGCKVHNEKKEWESLDNLKEFESTQSNLKYAVAKAIDHRGVIKGMRQLATSPYLYGTDISSTSILKKMYQDKYQITGMYSVAMFDTEADMINDGNQTIICTAAYGNQIFISVQRDWLGIGNEELWLTKLNETIDFHLSQFKDRNLQITFKVGDTEADIIKLAFKQLHEWQPDIVAIWNMAYDIPKIIEALERVGINPASVFSEPSLPENLKYFKWVPGKTKRTTASGVNKGINPAEQWHVVDFPASFKIIDAMCAYRYIRLSKQEDKKYSLDFILKKVLGLSKFKLKQADHLIDIPWHQLMQTEYKYEYMVYAIFDVFAMVLLDEKTKDLCASLPFISGISDFENFNSQPKRIINSTHFYCLKKGCAIASTGLTPEVVIRDEDDEYADETLDLSGWILMLKSHFIINDGLACIEEDANCITNILTHVGDLDCSSSYPSATRAMNVSSETTLRRIIDIKGIPEEVYRMQNINLLQGHVNAIEYMVTMLDLPKPQDMLTRFRNKGIR